MVNLEDWIQLLELQCSIVYFNFDKYFILIQRFYDII
jgi:hypothetical protein